jgi:hypothetical protein
MPIAERLLVDNVLSVNELAVVGFRCSLSHGCPDFVPLINEMECFTQPFFSSPVAPAPAPTRKFRSERSTRINCHVTRLPYGRHLRPSLIHLAVDLVHQMD